MKTSETIWREREEKGRGEERGRFHNGERKKERIYEGVIRRRNMSGEKGKQ